VNAFRFEREPPTARAARCIKIPRHEVGRAAGGAGLWREGGEGFNGARSIDLANPEPYAVDPRKQTRGVLAGEGDKDALAPQACGGEVSLEGVGEGGDLDQAIGVARASRVGNRGALHAAPTLARNPNRDWTIRVQPSSVCRRLGVPRGAEILASSPVHGSDRTSPTGSGGAWSPPCDTP
jgi:hypothetical protein